MKRTRLALLMSWVVIVPTALALGAAAPATAEPPSSTFGSHVSTCAQQPPGFSGRHNPSHHRGHAAAHAMTGMHC